MERPAVQIPDANPTMMDSKEYEHADPMKPKANSPQGLRILGVDISFLPERLQFAVCIFGVLSIYQLSAYFQEACFRVDEFSYSWFMALFTFSCGFFCSSLERLRDGDFLDNRAPKTWYIALGALILASNGLTNSSLNYVNYPTQVVFKSAKVIPVMLGGLLLLNKRYSILDYVSAVFFFVGLATFSLAEKELEPDFNPFGIILLVCALCGDAFIGNTQEKIFRRFKVSNTELVQCSYFCGAVMCLAVVLYTGEFWAAIELCRTQPEVLTYLAGYSLAGYSGVYFVLALIDRFGAVTAVVVTSCRKLLTIGLSFVLFPKPFSMAYVHASVFLFIAMMLNAIAKTVGKAFGASTAVRCKNTPKASDVSNAAVFHAIKIDPGHTHHRSWSSMPPISLSERTYAALVNVNTGSPTVFSDADSARGTP